MSGIKLPDECKHCLCHTCAFDYGRAVGCQSQLCRECFGFACDRCQLDGVKQPQIQCDDYVKEE